LDKFTFAQPNDYGLLGTCFGKEVYIVPYPIHYFEDLKDLRACTHSKVRISSHNAALLISETIGLFKESK